MQGTTPGKRETPGPGPQGNIPSYRHRDDCDIPCQGDGSTQEPKDFLGDRRQEGEMNQSEFRRTKLVLRTKLGQRIASQ